jgi:hypothetical protein
MGFFVVVVLFCFVLFFTVIKKTELASYSESGPKMSKN